MPAKSEAQRRYLFSKFGAAWAKKHHFDNTGKLPERVHGKRYGRVKDKPKGGRYKVR